MEKIIAVRFFKSELGNDEYNQNNCGGDLRYCNEYKCNLFWYRIAKRCGVSAGLPNIGWMGFYPPGAKDLYNWDEMPNWTRLPKGEIPQPGDVGSDGKHIGVKENDNTTIGASLSHGVREDPYHNWCVGNNTGKCTWWRATPKTPKPPRDYHEFPTQAKFW